VWSPSTGDFVRLVTEDMAGIPKNYLQVEDLNPPFHGRGNPMQKEHTPRRLPPLGYIRNGRRRILRWRMRRRYLEGSKRQRERMHGRSARWRLDGCVERADEPREGFPISYLLLAICKEVGNSEVQGGGKFSHVFSCSSCFPVTT
jgi:hypothetical protein